MKHFDISEFRCNCGKCLRRTEPPMDPNFLDLLDGLRDLADFPFIITSGYRCSEHPIEKAKQSPGPHSTGKAADIALFGNRLHTVLFSHAVYWFTGIGLNQKGDISQRFLHLDTCEAGPNRPRPHVWTY